MNSRAIRRLGEINLEEGFLVRIEASVGVPTAEALEWAEEIIARKRRELARATLLADDSKGKTDG